MFVIYEKSSTLIMGKVYMGEMRPDHRKAYKTMSAAKAALSRASKQWWNLLGRYGDPTDNDPQYRMGIAEADYFHKHIEKSVTKRNLMNDKEFSQPVNTPNYMSPASETYWSM